jgi:excisionase family DNA binding protein
MVMTENDSRPEMLTLEESADVARVSIPTIRRLAASGKLPVVRLSRRLLRVRREDLERLLEPQAVEA